jgi:hypothetical protein
MFKKATPSVMRVAIADAMAAIAADSSADILFSLR